MSITNGCTQSSVYREIYNKIISLICVHQVCCGVRRWRVYHLYCNGFEEQELWLSTGVCLGT